MRIENEVRLDFDDVLIRPKRSRLLSRKSVTLHRTFKFPHSPKIWGGVPIVASNMDTIGTFEVAKILDNHSMLTCIHKHYDIETWISKMSNKLETNWNNIIPSMGIGNMDWAKMRQIRYPISDGLQQFLCLDVANGYSQQFVDHILRARDTFPRLIIIAGNVATPEMTEQLIISGADIVKVGIGPGSACTTRKVTGVGIPQLSAIIECADAAHGLNGHIMADGGSRFPGDVAKAFCAGADFVMLGGMFAFHVETGLTFKGMSSEAAMKEHNGGVADYKAPEGKLVEAMKCRGPLEDTIKEILGGVRSACTYIGAENLKTAPKCTTFVRVNHQYNTVFGE